MQELADELRIAGPPEDEWGEDASSLQSPASSLCSLVVLALALASLVLLPLVALGQTSIDLVVTPVGSLQSRVDALHTSNRPLLLKGGDETISSTVTYPQRSGGVTRGSGSGRMISVGDSLGARSNLVWAGGRTLDDHDPMIKVNGTEQVFEHVSFHGDTRANAGSGGTSTLRAPVALLLDNPGTYPSAPPFAGYAQTLGTGKMTLRNVFIQHFRDGIVCGSGMTDANCDSSLFDRVCFHRCDRGFVVNNWQGLSYKWVDWRNEGGVGVVFDFNAGGKFMSYGGFVADTCTVLELDPPPVDTVAYPGGTEGATTYPAGSPFYSGFGANGNSWSFYGLELDSQAIGSLLLHVKSTDGPNDDGATGSHTAGAVVLFSGLHLPTSGAWGGPMFKLKRNTILILDNCTNMRAGMIEWDASGSGVGTTAPYSHTPVVIITNSTTWDSSSVPRVDDYTDFFLTASSVDWIRTSVFNVRHYLDGQPIADTDPDADGVHDAAIEGSL